MKKHLFLASLIIVGACAKTTHEIPAQYVSPMQYESYDCKQIQQEMQTIQRRVSEVGGRVDKTASTDKVQTGIGVLLFWPTLFFLDGDTPEAAEYARLKGEHEALDKAAVQKNCYM